MKAKILVCALPALILATFHLEEAQQPKKIALGLTIQPWEVRDADDFEKVFASLNKQRPDGLYVPSGALMGANQKRTIGFALKSRLPSMYPNREDADAGGLMSYGADVADNYRRIFRGQNPEGSQACRSASGAANEVRAGD
jgi:hypothetical protein